MQEVMPQCVILNLSQTPKRTFMHYMHDVQGIRAVVAVEVLGKLRNSRNMVA